jgi:protein-S-isoprenylcysteine O-methyltransferase Ste14
MANSACRQDVRIESRRKFMSFGLYAAGLAIVIAGLIYGAHLMHVPAQWIAVGAIVLLGLGILTGVKATRQKDPS